MYKLLILLSLFDYVKPEESIEWYNGRWVPVVQYPRVASLPSCDQISVTLQVKTDAKCTCGDKGEVSYVHHMLQSDNSTYLVPVIIIHSSAEVQGALNAKCKCDNKDKMQTIYRKINDNYFVVYGRPYYVNTEQNPNTAILLLKKVPKLSELRQVMASIDDLSQREAGHFCNPNFFVSEF